jgi:Tol biopolymer transport system component/C-terminal processing protease CtpA/Prc
MHRVLVISLMAAGVLAQGRPAPAPAPAPRLAFAEPAIAPDGSEIAFVSGGDIWTVPAAGGQARLLVSSAANDTHPVYSPDKSQLAFVSTRTGGGDIYVLTIATGDVRRVTYDDGMDQLDGWSRDGQYLYFFSSTHDLSGGMNDVYRVNSRGGTPMPVSADRYANEFFSAPSPDGRTLAMSARGTASGQWWRHGHSHLDEAEIWLRDLTAPDTPAAWRALTNGGAKDLWPMWSGDASLYFMSDRSGAENIWRIPTSGSAAPKQITTFTDGRLLWPSITLRGDTIAFERDFHIWKLDTASGKAAEVPITRVGAPAGPAVEHVRLTNQFQDLALSPDGKKIAFAARGEIFAASARDGGDAARITMTPALEQAVAWSPDSRKLVYTSERDAANHGAGSGAAHLVVYDFATQKETMLTSAVEADYAPHFSPDGKAIAFVRAGTELRVLDLASKQERLLAKGIIADPVSVGRPIAWSPDGKWLAFLNAGTRGFTNVSVVAAAGGEAKPISFLANENANSVAWSPDGTFVLFDTSQRTETSQLARVDLMLKTPKFREDQFRDLFNEEQAPRRPASPADEAAPKPATSTEDTSSAAKAGAPKPADPKKVNTDIVFDGIRQRLSLLPIGVDAGSAVISPDGKTVVMIAAAGGQQNLYAWSIDDTARERPVARQLTTTAGGKSDVAFTPDSKEVYYLDDGRVQAVTLDRREVRAVAVTAELDVDFATEKMIVFDQAWRLLREQFFDPAFHGIDWNAARAKVEPYIAGARTPDEMRRIASLMIGELNASHMGINAPGGGGAGGGVGHLGVDFDRAEYEEKGQLRISHVVPLGPAALAGIHQGDVILAVDAAYAGAQIFPYANLDALLENKVNRRTVLTINPMTHTLADQSREVAVRPISATTDRGLRYREWVEQKRAYVLKASNGRLGYVHMLDMGAGSLAQLYVDLDADNIGHDGVVIDVRNNNGGFVNAYALDVFSRQHYLNMTQRGLPTAPARSSLGQRALEKPTVLVTNQHSLSDAEDFTEGYRAMKLGKVVGEPTAGWIIYTWNTRLLDGTILRLPRSRITDRSGAPMELHPRPVDVEVKRPIGESYGPRDSQLDKAVDVLLASLRGSSH